MFYDLSRMRLGNGELITAGKKGRYINEEMHLDLTSSLSYVVVYSTRYGYGILISSAKNGYGDPW